MVGKVHLLFLLLLVLRRLPEPRADCDFTLTVVVFCVIDILTAINCFSASGDTLKHSLPTCPPSLPGTFQYQHGRLTAVRLYSIMSRATEMSGRGPIGGGRHRSSCCRNNRLSSRQKSLALTN